MDEQTKEVTLAPQMGVAELKESTNHVIQVVRESMRENVDYGIIPGTNSKSKVLLQPGAEKLAKFFGLVVKPTLLDETLDMETGFIRKKYQVELIHFATGKFAGSAIRVAHNFEKKFRTQFKREKNRMELLEMENTIEGMAQKRAIVAAVRQATMATEIFSDDRDVPEDTPVPNDEGVFAPNPYRNKLLADLFVTAADRGFNQDLAKKVAYKYFNVDSLTKLSDDQLTEFTNKLIHEWHVVKEGEKPRKMAEKSAENEGQKEDDSPSEQSEPLVGEVSRSEVTTSPKPAEANVVEENLTEAAEEIFGVEAEETPTPKHETLQQKLARKKAELHKEDTNG